MRRPLSLLFVLFVGVAFTGACASGNARPKDIPAPGLTAQLTNRPFFGSLSSTAPANVEVSVTNRAAVPMIVRRIDINSVGVGEWRLSGGRNFSETLAPGETKAFTVFGTATSDVQSPTETLIVQAILEVEANGTRWREFVRSTI